MGQANQASHYSGSVIPSTRRKADVVPPAQCLYGQQDLRHYTGIYIAADIVQLLASIRHRYIPSPPRVSPPSIGKVQRPRSADEQFGKTFRPLDFQYIPRTRSYPLQTSITAVNGQLGTGDVPTSVRAEEDDGALEVGRVAHASHRDTVEPLIPELRVGVEDDFGEVGEGVPGPGCQLRVLGAVKSLSQMPYAHAL